jgi:hypothetical protein
MLCKPVRLLFQDKTSVVGNKNNREETEQWGKKDVVHIVSLVGKKNKRKETEQWGRRIWSRLIYYVLLNSKSQRCRA